jgi:hypothetical protein
MSLTKGELKKPDWLPDWKDITKYPDLKKASGRVWAWEFLRRNPKYQQLWDELAGLKKGPIYEDFSVANTLQHFERQFGASTPAPPAMTITDPEFKWRPQFTIQHPKHWIRPVDWPADEEFEVIGAELEHSTEVLVKFDLRLPQSRQLNSAKTILKTEAKRLAEAGKLGGEPRAWFHKYQSYLRVLDAKSSGATVNTIAAEILGIKNKDPEYRKAKVRDAFNAAKRLRDEDYLFLAAFEKK